MCKKYYFFLKSVLVLILFVFVHNVYSQNTASIIGKLRDASNGAPLAYATVIVKDASIGTNTDVEGNFRLFYVPTGQQKVVISYIGYKKKEVSLELIGGERKSIEVELEIEQFKTEDVVITAQLQGQQAAINQQLSSNTILNVVSKERIQELPDQNAAETIGRLPGIAVERDAGEGIKVTVRGISPKFNSITVNGERIPSTDPNDRSVDLSMVSTDVLEGIEVFKALTPDRDADAIGGTVNFVIKKAPDDFKLQVRSYLGYNEHVNEIGQLRFSFGLSNRFGERKKLGVIITGNYQRANRSSDFLNATYEPDGNNLRITRLNLVDRHEIRYRYGGSFTADYKLANGSILLSSFLGGLERDEVRWRRRYRIGDAYQERDARTRDIQTLLSTNSLSGSHAFAFLKAELNWRASYAITNQETPFLHYARFRELGAYTAGLDETKGPETIPPFAKNNLEETWFLESQVDNEDILDQTYTGQIDLKIPFKVNEKLEGYVKMGGKIRNNRRNRDLTRLTTGFAGIRNIIADDSLQQFTLDGEGRMQFSNFQGKHLDPNFLENQYELGPTLDEDKLNEFSHTFRDYYELDAITDLQDYEAGELISAAYFMSEISFGEKWLFMPGVRMEHTQNDYASIFGKPVINNDGSSPGGVNGLRDTVGNRTYLEILPMVHLKYKPLSWFDARVAITRSLSRPDYRNLVPWQHINYSEGILQQGNPNLKHTTVWNYDLFLSFYNKLGLFTIGGFYKEINDIDYIRTSRVLEAGPTQGFQFIRPINGEFKVKAAGVEVDLQTNLRFLPKPFDGILLTANYTYTHSETFFPLFDIVYNPNPPFTPIIIDTVRVGTFPGQPDHVFNFSIGYEKHGFSGRLSMVYQGQSLGIIGTRADDDDFTDAFVRWDLAIKQKFPQGFSLYLNINNISNTPERSFKKDLSRITEEQFFGWTTDIGFGYTF